MSEQQDLEKELELWQRRLQKRREQKARLGFSADPSIDLEIEDIEARLAKLRAQLGLEPGHVSPAPPTAQRLLPTFQITEPDAKLARLRANPRLFLCHASEDKDLVKQLYHLLKEAGYRPWLDKFDLLPGQKWRREIRNVINNTDNLVLVCLTKNSLTKWGIVQQEIKWALDILKQRPDDAIYLIPVRLEDCPAPEQLSHLHWVNLFEPDGFEYLTRALDFEIGHHWTHPLIRHRSSRD